MTVHYDSVTPYRPFKRGTTYWVRFSIRGQGQIIKSLGTRDEREAAKLAFEFYAQAVHNDKLGIKAKPKSFNECLNSYLRYQLKQMENGIISEKKFKNLYGITNRYIREFFEKESVTHITSTKVDRYWDWRNVYWTEGPGRDIQTIPYVRDGKTITRPVSQRSRKPPSGSTKADEAMALRSFFTWLRREGFISEVIEVNSQPIKPNPRPSFTWEEYGRLDAVATRRALGDEFLHPRVRRDRLRLRAYVELMAFTGMRPPEAANLLWKDILHFKPNLNSGDDDGRLACGKRIRLQVHGKDKNRTIVPMPEVYWSIQHLWDLCREELGRNPLPTESPFINSRGNVQRSFRNGLDALLEEAGLLYDYTGAKRSAYSLRHFFATQMIIAKVPFYALAHNMGTSPKMLQEFYVDATSEQLAGQLQPEWKMYASELAVRISDDD